MISTRFLPIVCGLVAVTLVPTFIHSYSDSAVRDGRTTASIPTMLAGYAGAPSGRNATWGQRRFESDDWTERIYRSGRRRGHPHGGAVLRRKIALPPSRTGCDRAHFDRTEVRRFAQRPDVPVHVLYADSDEVSLYALHYDGAFVEDPIRFQLRTAGELLFSGRKAMTLFFLSTSAGTAAGIESLPSLGLFFDAIDRFITTPAPSIAWMPGVPAAPGTVRAAPDAASTAPRGRSLDRAVGVDHADGRRGSDDLRRCSPPVQTLLLHRWIPRHRLRDQRLRGGRLLRRFVLRRRRRRRCDHLGRAVAARTAGRTASPGAGCGAGARVPAGAGRQLH